MEGEDEADALGKLFGRYSGWFYGIKSIVGAAVLVGLGTAMVAMAEGDGSPLRMVGWVFQACGGLLALVGFLRTRQLFEIRHQGVRYRSLFTAREIYWSDIDEIFVKKTTHVQRSGGRRSYYTIRITSEDDRIRLSAGFLKSVSALGIIQLLKLHHRGEVMGDHGDIHVPARLREEYAATIKDSNRTQPRRAKKHSAPARDHKPSSSDTLYDQAAQRLAGGTAAPEVEAWLLSQGLTAPAAAAMVDKALTTAVRRQAIRLETEAGKSDDKVTAQARAQLAQGVRPEKVERWLREQGMSDTWAAAVMQNLREERL
jgi:hypothetical protein